MVFFWRYPGNLESDIWVMQIGRVPRSLIFSCSLEMVPFVAFSYTVSRLKNKFLADNYYNSITVVYDVV